MISAAGSTTACGNPRGVTNEDACTFFPDGDYHFVDPSSTVQFCTSSASPARGGFPRGTPSSKRGCAIRKASSAPSASSSCGSTRHHVPGDCNGDGEVTVDELIRAMNIVLGADGTLDVCPAADSNGDGVVTVDDIIRAVNVALSGCPQ